MLVVAFRPEEGAGSQGMRPRLEAGTGEKTGFPWSRQEDMADTPLLGLLTARAGRGSVSLVRGNCSSSGPGPNTTCVAGTPTATSLLSVSPRCGAPTCPNQCVRAASCPSPGEGTGDHAVTQALTLESP